MLFKKGNVVEIGQSLQKHLVRDGLALSQAVILRLEGGPSESRIYEVEQIAESGFYGVVVLKAAGKSPDHFLGTKFEALGQKFDQTLENLGVFADDPVILFAA